MKPIPLIQETHGIATIDTGYGRPGMTASHLIEHEGHAVFIDTGASPAVPLLLQALAQKGIAREQVDYVIITHVHLDHAGGAGALLRELPYARLLAHPRAVPHLIDPNALILGATEVYGATLFQQLHGTITPAPAARMDALEDGATLDWRGRTLIFPHTPGHARHHLAVIDPTARAMFTGDAFGLSYREFDTDQGPFLYPTTSPVQFDPPAMHASIERLLAYQPETAFLTHFGKITGLPTLAAQLHEYIDQFVVFAQQADARAPDAEARLVETLIDFLHQRQQRHGCSLTREQAHRIMHADARLNAAGLLDWRRKQDKIA